MPYDALGNYTPAPGAITAAPGQVIQSNVWDNIHTDEATALTQIAQALLNKWTSPNILDANGGFEIWQRGAGAASSIAVAASTTKYTADRWYLATGANQACVVAAATPLNMNSQLAASIQRNAAQVGVTALTFGYPLDTDEVFRMRGQKMSLNFLAATGANWSPVNGTLVVTLYVGTGTPQKRGAGFANETNVLQISSNIPAGSAATSIVGTSAGTVPTNATQGELQFTWTPNGAAGATDTVTLDNVMLSAGTFQYPYDVLPFDVMMNMCKRHYRKTMPYGVAPAANAGQPGELSVWSQAAAQAGIWWQYEPIAMRATAAVTTFNPTGTGANFANITGGITVTVTVDPVGSNSASGVFMITGVATSANVALGIHAQADAGL